MNSSTGWPFLQRARCRWRTPGWRPSGSSGSLRVASTRSLSGRAAHERARGRRPSAWRRARSGRSSRRNGARSLVAGLESATSGSRSSSVARRFTNVELPRRSVVGSSASACAERAVLGRDRAGRGVRVADQVGEVVAALGDRASRRASSTTMKRVSASSSAVVSLTSRRALESSGLKYSVAAAACGPLPSSWVLKPLITPWRSLRAFGSSVLKSWSRSTGVVVFDGRSASRGRAASGSRPGRARSRRSGSRCPTATSAGSSPACPRAAARRAPGR